MIPKNHILEGTLELASARDRTIHLRSTDHPSERTQPDDTA